MRRLTGIGVVMVCLAGCGFESSPQQLPTPGGLETGTRSGWRPPHQPSDRTRLLAQLDEARAHWVKAGPITYELTVSLKCFCDPGLPSVSRVTGVTVLRSTGGHRPDGSSWGPSLRTVELLFSEARRLAQSDADEVTVEFDPRFRYPTRIVIDEWRSVIDDERTWVARLEVPRD